MAQDDNVTTDQEQAGQPGGLTPDDLYELRAASDVQAFPDGRRAAYVVTQMDREKNTYRSAIWICSTAGVAPARQFTNGLDRDTMPRLSPDGAWLAFLSTRADKPQIWVMPVDGGEARQVTRAKHGAAEIAWAPDSRRLAYTSAVGGPDDDEKKDDDPQKPAPTRVITRLRYKQDGAGFHEPDRWTRLFVADLEGDAEPRQITDGAWDDSQPSWSPDGAHLAFVSARMEDRDRSYYSDIWVVPAAGGAARQLTQSDGPYGSPCWSPDGQHIAYVGHQDPPQTRWTTHDHIWLIPAEGGAPRDLLAGWPHAVGDAVLSDLRGPESAAPLAWSPDADGLLFLATFDGSTQVCRVSPGPGGQPSAVTRGERQALCFSQARDEGTLCYIVSDGVTPSDLYACAPDGAAERRLTEINAALLAQRRLSASQAITFPSPTGGDVQGWLIPPLSTQGTEDTPRRPLIVAIHGGPHLAYGHAFFHEFQYLAGLGYGLFYCNPHGSAGYGQEFVSSIRADWGNRDYQDIMAGLDRALREPWADPQRTGVMGGSYGGYMTNWIVGHTDCFRAAVSDRGLSNLYSFSGTTDFSIFWEWELGDAPRADPQHLMRMSPIAYVEEMRAPLLIMHSEMDLRVAVEQAEQLFVALKGRGRETAFVRFPEESHGLSRSGKPSRRLERLEHIAAWFAKYLAPAQG